MNSPELNFLAAVGIGLVIGLLGGFALKSRRANAIWLAPVLALSGSLAASVLALIFGDDRQYGWKEPILQVALALAGVGLAYVLGAGRSADAQPAAS
jgi:ABC-type Fe3+-siderophore transport system permease subunit